MEYISKELCGFLRFKNAKRRKEKNPNIPQLILRFVTKSENGRPSPCCAWPVTCPPLLHDAFQGYVTVSEINELYSQLGRDPKPVPNPSLANPSPECEINPCPDGDSSKSATYEVCVAVQRELLPGFPQFSSSFTLFFWRSVLFPSFQSSALPLPLPLTPLLSFLFSILVHSLKRSLCTGQKTWSPTETPLLSPTLPHLHFLSKNAVTDTGR